MEKIYIHSNGQIVRLELRGTVGKLSDDLLDLFSGSIVKRAVSADGTLSFRDGWAKNGRNEKVLSKKRIMGCDLVIKKAIKSDSIKGECRVRLRRFSKIMSSRVMSLIFFYVANIFSRECSLYKKSLIFHASSLSRNGDAYLFIGKGGSGKSTICSLSKRFEIIHDDTTIVRKKGNKFCLYPPLSFETQPHLLKKELKRIFFIKKSKRNNLRSLSLKESLKESVNHCRSMALGNASLAFDNLVDLFKSVPVHRLYFKKDPSFWGLIEGLSG